MAQTTSIPTLEARGIDRTSRPIDLVHLAHQTLGDQRLEQEVLRMFERQVNLYFERVQATTDLGELEMGLHTLKGASLGIGAKALADLVAGAERALSESGQLDGEWLDDIGLAVAEVSGFILELIGD